MKVMVVGSGAREHALIWKLAPEHASSNLVCVPGNPGIAKLARCLPGDVGDPGALGDIAARESVDLTVVGPEVPLARGVADTFAARGLALFGPSQAAARLESSKAFAKNFMAARNVPTARYELFGEATAALDALRGGRFGFPVVLKADGLAAGKGVIVAPDRPSAERAVQDILVDQKFGAAGATLVMEEYLDGEEASFFAICDGETALALPAAEDHKRVYDDDQGPNTGGMGAFAPSPRVTGEVRRRVMREIVGPVLDGLREEGHPYRGTLYVGLMLTSAGPKVVEFNVRFGDPEAQVVLPMLDGELTPVLAAAASGSLNGHSCAVRPEAQVGVVLASGGYPGQFEKGLPIDGLKDVERMPDVLVFHAGTKQDGSAVVTAGGRVLTVVGRGTGFDAAIGRAYEAVRHISFPGMHVRHDIGRKALTFNARGRLMSDRQVLILMGSDSDASVMQAAADGLDQFGISYEMTVASAHRSPARVVRLIQEAHDHGVQVFIVGAGAAAHLAGVVAAHTIKPVVGVPIDSTALEGMDALLSTVQMPPGVPVATMAVGKSGATNAAVLAAQILAAADTAVAAKLQDYKQKLAETVEQAAERLRKG